MKSGLVIAIVSATIALSSTTSAASVPRRDSSINDWLTDLIQLVTGKDVTSFIVLINTALTESDQLVRKADEDLRQVLPAVGPEAKGEIESVLSDRIQGALETCAPVIADLHLLIPAITMQEAHSFADVSLIIEVVLGKTLEEFLIEVQRALLQAEIFLKDAIKRLNKVAENVPAESAGEISAVVSEKLLQTAKEFFPVMDVLDQLDIAPFIKPHHQ